MSVIELHRELRYISGPSSNEESFCFWNEEVARYKKDLSSYADPRIEIYMSFLKSSELCSSTFSFWSWSLDDLSQPGVLVEQVFCSVVDVPEDISQRKYKSFKFTEQELVNIYHTFCLNFSIET